MNVPHGNLFGTEILRRRKHTQSTPNFEMSAIAVTKDWLKSPEWYEIILTVKRMVLQDGVYRFEFVHDDAFTCQCG